VIFSRNLAKGFPGAEWSEAIVYFGATIFDEAPMDHALHIYRDYYIHEDIVPGYPAVV
jgi:hypothetical protein